MLGVPKKLVLAIEAVLYIAYNAPQGPISSKEIADRQGLPPRYLEQLMQKLVRAGVLRGVRGPRGGYLLARERRRITVADICAVLKDEGEAEVAGCVTPLGGAVVQPLMQRALDKMMEDLGRTTLADLCDEAVARKIGKRSDDRLDFAI